MKTITVGTITEKEKQELLSKKISDLPLSIEHSWLEPLIQKLYRELAQAGISFKPPTYLSDEWGCPQNVPVIGIPFYLADSRLYLLEGQMTGIEAETETEIMMYLRHEAGHAFNYAYRLYEQPEWEKVFGTYYQPYREAYRTAPFSSAFVRHLPGWYVQKHPDDDFAETFAIWLTPGSQWRQKYSGTPALNKLLYIDEVAQEYRKRQPEVAGEILDRPIQELTMTLGEWYRSNQYYPANRRVLLDIIDEDLKRLLPDPEGEPAGEILQSSRRQLVREVNYWTGLDRHILGSLVTEVIERVKGMGLKINPDRSDARILGTTVFLTALAMNYQLTGNFME